MSVTIIMPSYNSEKFIIESVESVLAQTYSNWELIIVDDCSPDDSNKIITKYVDSDCRIKLIKLQKNSGPAVARNMAIEAASGRYIAFLDSDDVWLPNKLETQINFMRENNLAFTYSSYGLVGEDNEDLGLFITKDKISYFDILKTCSVGCLTAIYDTEKIGKQYMPLILKRQDYGLWLKILKLIGETRGILEPLAIYRIRKNSVSSNKVKAAKYQWKIYREIEKLSFLKSLYYFAFYTYNGVTKYKNK